MWLGFAVMDDMWRTLCGVYMILLVVAGGTVASQDNIRHVSTDTLTGAVRGTRRSAVLGIDVNGEEITTVDEFLGIPYAAPPIGQLRFGATLPAKSWAPEIKDATVHGPVCPQDPTSFAGTQEELQDEDCLYLNVYAPYQSKSPTHKYPVLVFIHGGSYAYGTGNRYNGTALAHCGVVLVSINYRLGSLGFLTSGDFNMPGNYGLFDQIMALKWVRDNIAQFRGDPERVTIFGSSAGAASVGILMMSPLAQGLFHAVIAESGTANAMWATHEKRSSELAEQVVSLARRYGCEAHTVAQCIAHLRTLPWSALRPKQVCERLPGACTEVDPVFKPVVDDRLLTESPLQLLKKGIGSNIPYMTGTVRAEFGDHFNEGFDKPQMWEEVDEYILKQYGTAAMQTIKYHYTDWKNEHLPYTNGSELFMNKIDRAQVLTDLGLVAPTAEMAGLLSHRGQQKVYVYYFNHEISYHSVELNFVFGTPFIQGAVDEFEQLNIVKNFTEKDKKRSNIFMKLWVNFAKYGNPTPNVNSAGVIWQNLDETKMNYLEVTSSDEGLDLVTSNHFSAENVALWNILVPDISAKCNIHKEKTHEIDITKTWVFFGLTIGLLLVVIILLCVIIWGNHRAYKSDTMKTGGYFIPLKALFNRKQNKTL